MKLLLVWLFLTPCLLAGFKYPPKADDARVEVYRKVGDVELRMWIFGETDPAKPKPAIMFIGDHTPPTLILHGRPIRWCQLKVPDPSPPP